MIDIPAPPRGMEPAIREIEQTYAILRRRTWLFVAIIATQVMMAGFSGFLFTQVRGNTELVTAVHQQNVELQKTQAQQAAASTGFLRAFLDQQNYVCAQINALAKQAGVGGSLPNPAVCTVIAPH